MALPETLSRLSREELTSVVAAKRSDEVVDPRSGEVHWSFPNVDEEPTDWVAGTWDVVDGSFVAVALVGPGTGAELEAGEVDAYVRVTLGAEDVIKKAGRIVIY